MGPFTGVDLVNKIRQQSAAAVQESCVGDVLAVDPTRALARSLIREFAPEKLRPIQAVLTV